MKLDLTEFNSKVADLKAAKKKLAEEARSQVFEPLVEFLKANSDKVNIVAWEQYTPYFNDGDACEFSVRDIFIGQELPEEDQERWAEDMMILATVENPDECEWKKTSSYYDSYKKDYDQAVAIFGSDLMKKSFEIVKTISSIPDDVMLELFDDHVQVKITPSGILVEEYEHD